jgi:tetratricopeptide (TPR) repeat protein
MPRPDVGALYQQAQQELGQRHYQAARAVFLQILDLEPERADAHYGLATACFLQGDFLGAAHHFKETTRHDPKRAGAFINLGAIYNRLGRYEDAITTLTRGIQLEPARGEGYYNLGLVYRHLEQFELAVESYREAVRVNPAMADAHFNLANLLLEDDHYAEAADHYRQALRLRPDWNEARQGLEMAEEATAAPEPPSEKAHLLERAVDPMKDKELLQHLHALAQTTGILSREVGDDMAKELDLAVKELGTALLKPNGSGPEVAAKLKSFGEVRERFEKLRARLAENAKDLQAARERVASS